MICEPVVTVESSEELDSIESLDFEPACDSSLHPDGPPAAEWAVYRHPCTKCGRKNEFLCGRCHEYAISHQGMPLWCPQCGKVEVSNLLWAERIK